MTKQFEPQAPRDAHDETGKTRVSSIASHGDTGSGDRISVSSDEDRDPTRGLTITHADVHAAIHQQQRYVTTMGTARPQGGKQQQQQ